MHIEFYLQLKAVALIITINLPLFDSELDGGSVSHTRL